MSVDLHLHTTYSDGSWTPQQLVEAALAHSLKCIAVTDHDTTAGIAEAREAAGQRLQIIAGIEINTVLEDEIAGAVDIHVLGYFIDPSASALQELSKRQQQARLQLVEDALEKCRSLGIPLTEDLIRECAGSGSIGRPHIARAIVKAGGAADTAAAFERFMVRGAPDYIPRAAVQPKEAIAAIRAAGGVSSIAHPGKDPEMPRIIELLRQQGLHGIECYHRAHSLDLVKQYLHLAATKGMLVTGGSDCHGPSDGFPPSIGTVKVPPYVVPQMKRALATVA